MALWKIDPAHSEVKFKVKHLVVSTVTGHFNQFNATVETNTDDFSDAVIRFEADIASIDTKNAQRDGHLKSADFFDAENHPQITFEGNKLEKISDSEYKLHGTLNIRGTARSTPGVATGMQAPNAMVQALPKLAAWA